MSVNTSTSRNTGKPISHKVAKVMKAVQFLEYGAPDVLTLIDRDVPGLEAKQVLIRVESSSVNPLDWKLLSGAMRWLIPMKLPNIPGFDVAGEIVAVGSDVEKFSVGDAVFARLDSNTGGASAEYAVAGETAVAIRPDTITANEAAAIPLAGLTALQALRDKGGLQAGQHVLIVGGSGGVGHYAIQIAKAMGAQVTTVCSTRNLAFVQELGADEVIDYTQQTGFGAPGSYDVIFDCVGASPYSAFASSLKRTGAYVTINPTLGGVVRSVFVSIFSQRSLHIHLMKPSGADLETLGDWVKDNKLRTVIDTVFPLSELSKAYAQSKGGRTRGKIVIQVR